MKRERLAKLMDELFVHFDNLDLDGVCGMFAEDAEAENFTGQKATSRAEIKSIMGPYFAGSMGGSIKFDIHHTDIDDTKNVIWTAWTLNIINDGKVITRLPGSDTFEFNEDGFIIRNSVYCKSQQPLMLMDN